MPIRSAPAVLLTAAVLTSAALAPSVSNAAERPQRRGPGVPVRKDPFAPNTEIRRILATIPTSAPVAAAPVISPAHPVYTELRERRPGTERVASATDPAAPPIRLLGLIEGGQLSAILRVGSGAAAQVLQVVPGTVIEYGAFAARVRRVEEGRLILRTLGAEGEKDLEVGFEPSR